MTDPTDPTSTSSQPGDQRWLCVLDVNYCRTCMRIIELVSGVGWLHVYLPQRTGGPFGSRTTCQAAYPAAHHCTVCRAAVRVRNTGRPEIHADRSTGLPCRGIKQVAEEPRTDEYAFTELNE